MGLHDRLKNATAVAEGPSLEQAPERPHHRSGPDPYAELKTRVHHACIARLGPELFAAESAGDLGERVTRAVMEQLALDRTPLTREERRQLPDADRFLSRARMITDTLAVI